MHKDLETLHELCCTESFEESKVSGAISGIIWGKVDVNQLHGGIPVLHAAIKNYKYDIIQLLMAKRYELDLDLLVNNEHGQTIVDLILAEESAADRQKLLEIFTYFLTQELELDTSIKFHLANLRLNYPAPMGNWSIGQQQELQTLFTLLDAKQYYQILQTPNLHDMINVQDTNGDSILYRACMAKNWELAKQLLEKGAYINRCYMPSKHPLDVFKGNVQLDRAALDFLKLAINCYPGNFPDEQHELLNSISLHQFLDGRFVPQLQDTQKYLAVYNKLLRMQNANLCERLEGRFPYAFTHMNIELLAEVVKRQHDYISTQHLAEIKQLQFQDIAPKERHKRARSTYQEAAFLEEQQQCEAKFSDIKTCLENIIRWDGSSRKQLYAALLARKPFLLEVCYRQFNQTLFTVILVQNDAVYYVCFDVKQQTPRLQITKYNIIDANNFGAILLNYCGKVEEVFVFEKTLFNSKALVKDESFVVDFDIYANAYNLIYDVLVCVNFKSQYMRFELLNLHLKLLLLDLYRNKQFVSGAATDYTVLSLNREQFRLVPQYQNGFELAKQSGIFDAYKLALVNPQILEKPHLLKYPFPRDEQAPTPKGEFVTYDECLFSMRKINSRISLPLNYDMQDDISTYSLKAAAILLGIHPRDAKKVIIARDKTNKRCLKELTMLYLGIESTYVKDMSDAQIELVLSGVSKQIAACGWVNEQHVKICKNFGVTSIRQLRKINAFNSALTAEQFEQFIDYPFEHLLHPKGIARNEDYLAAAQKYGLSLEQIRDLRFGILQARAVAHGLSFEQAISLNYPQLLWFLNHPNPGTYDVLKRKQFSVYDALIGAKFKYITLDMLGSDNNLQQYYQKIEPTPLADGSAYNLRDFVTLFTSGDRRTFDLDREIYGEALKTAVDLNSLQKLGLLYGYSEREVMSEFFSKTKLFATIFFGLHAGHIIDLDDDKVLELLPKSLEPLVTANEKYFADDRPFAINNEPFSPTYPDEISDSMRSDDVSLQESINGELELAQDLDLRQLFADFYPAEYETSILDTLLLQASRERDWTDVIALLQTGANIFKDYPAGESPLESIAFIEQPNAEYIRLLKFLAVHCAKEPNISFYSRYNIHYPLWGIIAATQPLTQEYVPEHTDSKEYKAIYSLLRRMQLKIMLHNYFELHPWYHSIDGVFFKPTGSYGKLMRYEFLQYLRKFRQVNTDSQIAIGADELEVDRLLSEYIPTGKSNVALILSKIAHKDPVAFEMQVMYEQFAHNFNAFVAGDLFYVADRSQGEAAIKIYSILDRNKFLAAIKNVLGYRAEDELFLHFFGSRSIKLLQKFALPKQVSFNCTFASMDALMHVLALHVLEGQRYTVTDEHVIADETFVKVKNWVSIIRNYGVYLVLAEQALYSSPASDNKPGYSLPSFTKFKQLLHFNSFYGLCRAQMVNDHYSRFYEHANAAGIEVTPQDKASRELILKNAGLIYDLGPRILQILRSHKLNSTQLYALRIGVPLELALEDWVTRENVKFLLFYSPEIVKNLTDLQLAGLHHGLSLSDVQQKWLQPHHVNTAIEFHIYDIKKLEKISESQYSAAKKSREYADRIFACEYFSDCHNKAISTLKKLSMDELLSAPGPQVLAFENRVDLDKLSDPRLNALAALAIDRCSGRLDEKDLEEYLSLPEEKLRLLSTMFMHPYHVLARPSISPEFTFYMLTAFESMFRRSDDKDKKEDEYDYESEAEESVETASDEADVSDGSNEVASVQEETDTKLDMELELATINNPLLDSLVAVTASKPKKSRTIVLIDGRMNPMDLIKACLDQGYPFHLLQPETFSWIKGLGFLYGLSLEELEKDSLKIIYWKIYAKLFGAEPKLPSYEPSTQQVVTSFYKDIDIEKLKGLSDIQVRAIRSGLTLEEVCEPWFTEEHFKLGFKWGIYIRQLIGATAEELQCIEEGLQESAKGFILQQQQKLKDAGEPEPDESDYRVSLLV